MTELTTPNGLTAGDRVTYEDYHGQHRAAIISAVLAEDLVAVRFVDVNPESGGGFDYDSPNRYVKCDDLEKWQALADA